MLRKVSLILTAALLCLGLLPGALPAQAADDPPVSVEAALNLGPAGAFDDFNVACVSVTKGNYNAITPAVDDYYINLQTEKLYIKDGLEATRQSMWISTDGGKGWKPVTALPNTGNGQGGSDISSFLKKGGNILLASSVIGRKVVVAADAVMDEEGNVLTAAVAGANIYDFGNFNKRPAAPRCKIDYSVYADLTGRTNGKWTLDTSTANLEIAPSKSKKLPDDGIYYTFKPGDGVNVLDGSGGKVIKSVYLIRSAPDPATRTPASKTKKISASSVLKTPKFKIDYKKELIKVKENTVYVTAAETADGYSWATDAIEKPMSKEEAKAGVPLVQVEFDYGRNNSGITYETSYYGQTLMLRTAATFKKPASAVQTISVAERKPAYEVEIKPTISSGTFRIPNGMECYNENKSKWMGGSIKSAGEYLLRFKNTAKFNVKSGTTSGNVTSLPIKLNLIEGTYGTSEKTGVVDYEVADFPRYPGLVVGRVDKRAAPDQGKSRYAYEITPDLYFPENIPGVPSPTPYEQTIHIDLLGYEINSKLLDVNMDELTLAAYPTGGGSLADGTVYIKAELESSIKSEPEKVLEIKEVDYDPDNYRLTVTVAKPATDAVEEFPVNGSTFSLKLSLVEEGDGELCLTGKFNCRPVVFTFKIPTYTLKLPVSNKLTYSVSGPSTALLKPFDGTAESFKELFMYKEKVPTLTVYNQVPDAWYGWITDGGSSADKASIKFLSTNTSDKFYVYDTSNDKMLEVDALDGSLTYYSPDADPDNALSGVEKYLYFFILAEDGNLYPFRLVIPEQDDTVTNYTSFAGGSGDFNTLTLSIQNSGKFKAAGQLENSMFTVALSSGTGGSSTTYDVCGFSYTNEKTLVLYLSEVLTVDSTKKNLKLTVAKEAYDPGIVVGGANIMIVGSKTDPAPTFLPPTPAVNGNTVTVTLTTSGVYNFKNISTTSTAASDSYVTVADATSAGTVSNVTVSSSGDTTMTVTITFSAAPTGTFKLNVQGISFNPAWTTTVITADITIPAP